MPIVSICSQPHCGTRIPINSGGRCDKHKRESRRNESRERKSSSERGYDTAWQKARAIKLRSQPLCEDCLRHDRTTLAKDIHHIAKIETAPELRLEQSNLMSLCRWHHNRRTKRGE